MTKSKKPKLEKFLKNNVEWIFMKEIARRSKISYRAVIKWISKLESEDKIEVKRLGGMKFVRWKGR